MVLVVISENICFSQKKFYAHSGGPIPDTMKVNTSFDYRFYPIAPYLQPTPSYAPVAYTLLAWHDDITDTSFAHFTHISNQALYTVIYGADVYTDVVFTPKQKGDYQVLLVLRDPSGRDEIAPDSLRFRIIAIDTIAGSYCTVTPNMIDFGKAYRNITVRGSFQIRSPYYATEACTVKVDSLHSSVFGLEDADSGTLTINPWAAVTYSLTAAGSLPGMYRDTVRFYTTATNTSDTILLPMQLEVLPDDDVPLSHKLYIEPSLDIWPNPMSEYSIVRVTLAGPSQILLGLYDVLGNRRLPLPSGLYERGVHDFSIFTKDLPAGIYVLRLSTDNTVISKSVIKLK